MSNQLENRQEHIINMTTFLGNRNIKRNSRKKDEFLDAYITKLFLPYIIYLKVVLSDDEIYKNLTPQDAGNELFLGNSLYVKESKIGYILDYIIVMFKDFVYIIKGININNKTKYYIGYTNNLFILGAKWMREQTYGGNK